MLFYIFDRRATSLIQKAHSWDTTETYNNMFEEYGTRMYSLFRVYFQQSFMLNPSESSISRTPRQRQTTQQLDSLGLRVIDQICLNVECRCYMMLRSVGYSIALPYVHIFAYVCIYLRYLARLFLVSFLVRVDDVAQAL
jgi:hypothetical protein